MAKSDHSKALEKRVIREVYKPEPEKKGWGPTEELLISTFRKLTEDQRLEAFSYVQNLAIARIRTRLEKRSAASDRRFQRFMSRATSEVDEQQPGAAGAK